MGNIIMVCCSNEELVRYEDENPKPVVYTYPDHYLDEVDVHRSASEITRIALENITPLDAKL